MVNAKEARQLTNRSIVDSYGQEVEKYKQLIEDKIKRAAKDKEYKTSIVINNPRPNGYYIAKFLSDWLITKGFQVDSWEGTYLDEIYLSTWWHEVKE